MHTVLLELMKNSQKQTTKRVENKKALSNEKAFVVVMDGIEPPTQGFSVLCSTN